MLKPVELIEDDESLAEAMAVVASAMADASRLKILCALMDGRAWTATELSAVADISPRPPARILAAWSTAIY
jgi:DNA-binding transcriptional ArsR family regulator